MIPHTWKALVASLCLVGSSAIASAQTATEQLQQFVERVSAATGQFSQSTTDAQGQARPEQTGEFAFKRPGLFKWQVRKPYEQLVLSDGKTLYQYDPDLSQLSQRDVDEAIGASPAAILFGSSQLEQSFELRDRKTKDESGVQWLRATPKSADAGFDYVDIAFKAGTPVQLVLLDAFGQQTQITLSELNTHVDLNSSDFHFTPPKDVDVVDL